MKKILLYTFLIFITLQAIAAPAKTITYAAESLNLCLTVIIPSLLPFFICSGLLIHSGVCGSLSRFMQPVMKPLFNVNGAGSAAFILGIISGYPLGAVTACQLYESGYLGKSETERLLSFCNNSGPLFILGSVGVSLFHSVHVGVMLYISHILASLTVGIIMRFFNKKSYSPPPITVNTVEKSVGEMFQAVISSSVSSILSVSAAIIFCSVISKNLLSLFPLKGTLHSVFLGGLEFVNGISALSNGSASTGTKLILTSWMLGFSGLSVHLQVMAVTAMQKLSLKPYILGKLLHGGLSALFTAVTLKFFTPITPTFSNGIIGYSFIDVSLFSLVAAAFTVGMVLGVTLLLYLRLKK